MRKTTQREQDLLLKMNGLRKSCGLSWPYIADVYEAESGLKVAPGALRNRVWRATARQRAKMVAENAAVLDRLSETVENRQKREDFDVENRQIRDFEPKKPLKTSFLGKLWEKVSNWWAKAHDFDDF